MINCTPSTLFPSIGGPAPRQKFWITNWNQTKNSGSEGYGAYISSKEKSCPSACQTCRARHLSTALKKTTASAFKHPTAPTPLWVFDYFEKLIDGIDHPDLQIYLYHIPQVSGVGLSIELVTRLRAAYPDVIVGIKDSSGDWDNTRRLLAIDGLIVYPGAELPVIDRAVDLPRPDDEAPRARQEPVLLGQA